MDDDDELLMHVAAGTDLPTALAAVERDEHSPTSKVGFAWVFLIVIAAVWWFAR